MNDDILEDDDELFFGNLTTTDPSVFLNPFIASVVIIEDPSDSKY